MAPSTTDDEAPAAPGWKPLGPRQRRVLGVLVEKAKTTPAAYPMTVNGIVAACNQKNNRDPLMSLTNDDVEQVLEELRALGVVVEAPESTRVVRYRHRGYEWLGVSKAELAVMAELLLRGAQTLGELRGRAARMEPIADLAALKPIVDALVQRGLMLELTPHGRGQVVGHGLYEAAELAELRARFGGHAAGVSGEPAVPPSRPPEAAGAPAEATPGTPAEALARLRREVAELRAEVARLSEQVRDLEARLGAASS